MLNESAFNYPASLSVSFTDIIWKIEVDTFFPYVAVETRNSENHTAYFSAFDFFTGEILFKDITVEDSWHWSLDRISNGMIYLHSFMAEDSPEHLGIIALDNIGKVKWQRFNLALSNITSQGILAYNPRIQPKIFELLDFFEGNVIGTSLSNVPNVIIRDILLPYYASEASAISKYLPQNTLGEIALITYKDKIIISCHTSQDNVMDQVLLIYVENHLLFKDELASGILKRNPESFFIFNNHLFCIRGQKREIVSYLL